MANTNSTILAVGAAGKFAGLVVPALANPARHSTMNRPWGGESKRRGSSSSVDCSQ